MLPIAKIRDIVARHREGVEQLFVRYDVPLPVTPENVFEVAAQMGTGFTRDLMNLGNRRGSKRPLNYTGSATGKDGTIYTNEEVLSLEISYYNEGVKAGLESTKDFWLPVVIGLCILLLVVLFAALHYAEKAKKV